MSRDTHVQGEIGVVREVFNAFFKYYPFCYGYWKKLADFEKTHSDNDTAKQVRKMACAELCVCVCVCVCVCLSVCLYTYMSLCDCMVQCRCLKEGLRR